MTDLELAYDALSGKKAAYDLYWRYYDGDHPMVYAASRLREIFNNLDIAFNENWCEIVVAAELERINLRGIRAPGNDAAQARLDELWAVNQLGLESDDVHEAALVTGEAYVIVWPDKFEGTATPLAYYNDPRQCHVFYDSENPRHKRYAAKWWRDDDGYIRMTLYYPDRLEYYISSTKSDVALTARAFGPLSDPGAAPQIRNPYGEIPVFQFRTHRVPKSDLKSALPIQDVINKLLSNMVVAAEYGAFRQRYIISNAEIKGRLRNAPNEIWDLPAGDGQGQTTQVGEFAATDLANYLSAIDSMAGSMSSITRTPKHYFSASGGDPSGEALITMEAPLVKKANDRIERFTPEWKSMASFMLRLSGITVPPEQIEPQYDPTQSTLPRTTAEIRHLSVQAGIPLPIVLKREGWNEQQMAEFEEARDEDPDWQMKMRNIGLVDAQLGASQDTLLARVGYDPARENQQRALDSTDAAEQLLTAMERR